MAMRELDGRHLDSGELGHVYVAAEWDQERNRTYLVMYGTAEICRCRIELHEVAEALQHPFIYLQDYLPTQ